MKYEKLLDVAQNQPHVRSEYQNRYMMVVAESLVDTLILRMNPTADPNRDLVALFRRGLIFSPYFYRAMAAYEADQSLTMPAYVETLFAGASEKVVREDEVAIAKLESQYLQQEEVKRQGEREEQQRRLRASRLNTLLMEAQEFIRQQQYDVARAKLQEVLQEDPESATAYFYLAQIASQQKDYSTAFSLYQRAGQSKSATPVIRAWSKLRMARYLASEGNFAQARAYFNEVVQMQGELDGAREQAQNALAQLPKE
jgi:tetratricopeptide (TPR) repeat protein